MKTLEEIKENIAKEHGAPSWAVLMDYNAKDPHKLGWYSDKVTRRYAKEMLEAIEGRFISEIDSLSTGQAFAELRDSVIHSAKTMLGLPGDILEAFAEEVTVVASDLNPQNGESNLAQDFGVFLNDLKEKNL